MAVRYGFFDSVSGDRVYSADLFSRHIAFTGRDGVLFTGSTPLKVVQASPVALKVLVLIGAAFVQGRWFEVYSEEEQLPVTTPDPTLPRIDRAVIRLDYVSREIKLAVKAGTAAASPAAPALTRDSLVWELSLAQVYVAAGATQILDANITDERFNSVLCGLSVPLSHTSGVYNAACAAKNTSNQSIPSGSETLVVFSGTDYMTETTMWTAGNPGRIYAPYPGLYYCQFRGMWAASSIGSRTASIIRNNVTRYSYEVRPGSTDPTTSYADALIKLDKGDFVASWVYQNTGGSLVLSAAAEYTPRLEVIRLGD
jgi:hypothetical protein